MKLNKIINVLNNKGYIIIKNILKKKETNKIKKKLDKILEKRLQAKEVVGHHDNQIMFNYFFEDKSLLKLIYFSKVDLIFKKILEPDYVLQSTSAQNRASNKIDKKKKKIATEESVGDEHDEYSFNEEFDEMDYDIQEKDD